MPKELMPVEVSRLSRALFALRDLRSCCNLPEDNAFKKSCMTKADEVLSDTRANPDPMEVTDDEIRDMWQRHQRKSFVQETLAEILHFLQINNLRITKEK